MTSETRLTRSRRDRLRSRPSWKPGSARLIKCWMKRAARAVRTRVNCLGQTACPRKRPSLRFIILSPWSTCSSKTTWLTRFNLRRNEMMKLRLLWCRKRRPSRKIGLNLRPSWSSLKKRIALAWSLRSPLVESSKCKNRPHSFRPCPKPKAREITK